MRLVDTHCHLNDVEAFPHPERAIAEAAAAGVDRILVVGTDVESSELAIRLAETHSGLWATAGWHPNYATACGPEQFERLDAFLDHPKVVAVGEVGLDTYRDYAPLEDQVACLRAQLELATKHSKPVILHCREAYDALLDLLEERPQPPLLFHCFSGDARHAARALALGGVLGVDGPVTYKKNADLRALLASVPRDRLVLESDSPWLPPHPHRGKPNRPAWLPLVNVAVATSLGISPGECAELTSANAERFFGFTG